MSYRFEAAVSAPVGKLSREERSEIRDYIHEQRIEAGDAEKALRLLCKKLQGKSLSLEGSGKAQFFLPDYGTACLVKVRAYEEA